LGVYIILFFVILAVSADGLQALGLIESYQVTRSGASYAEPFTCTTEFPVRCFPFGADKTGRDILSRVVYGARVSVSVAVVGALSSLLIGTLYGVIAGYFGGWVDSLLMRIVDFWLGLPSLIVIILLQVMFQALDDYQDQLEGLGAGFVRGFLRVNREMSGLLFVYVVIGALSWIGVARLARGQVLSLRGREYIEAARSIGASRWRIIRVHLLPNLIGTLIAAEMLAIPAYIFTEASLSFLGLGVRPPVPSWGEMIIRAQREGFTARPYLVASPAIALALLSLGFTLLGDALADRLDPREG
jgi:oligopeptide transport system permease protein